MRTVRVSVTSGGGLLGGSSIEMSTEVIVDNDTEAEDAGREAMDFLINFANGTGQAAGA